MYKTVVIHAIVTECWALGTQEEHRLHTMDMIVIRWNHQGKTIENRQG